MTIAAAELVALATPTAAFADASGFTANVREANGSGASATATISLDGNMAAISLSGQGFFDGFDEIASQTLADGTPVMSVIDSAPFYGGVAVSLTTEVDTSPDSALAVDRFPTSGTIDDSRTIELPQEVADNLGSLHLVVHATDLNGDGEIGPVEDEDGNEIPSSVNEDLPIEATAPAACG